MCGTAETYQFRNYPRHVAERAWQRIAGSLDWISLDRFAAMLSRTTRDDQISRDLVKAAVCGKAFLGTSGRRLLLFLPEPSPYSRRSEAWRVSAKEYADSATRFAAIGMMDWYLKSVWVPVQIIENWCSTKGYETDPPKSTVDNAVTSDPVVSAGSKPQRAMVSKELRGKPGPADRHDWKAMKATAFSLMNLHGEFCRERGWYQQKLIIRILEELDNPPDESGLKRRLPDWLEEWRGMQTEIAKTICA